MALTSRLLRILGSRAFIAFGLVTFLVSALLATVNLTSRYALKLYVEDQLTRIPWAALPLPDGRRLCEAARVVLVPGVRLGVSSRARATGPVRARPLVVAADAGRLEHVAAEVHDIARIFPGAEVLEGSAATVARFLARAPLAPWIHFAGHGVYRAESPYGSGLQLADGWLSAEILVEERFVAERVVLAACQSARALVQPGEEWFGLARTLLRGGVTQVIAAQWDVEDESARRFMAGFYTRLAGGETAPAALSGTQADQARLGVHPLDWGGFVALGGPETLGDSHDA